MSESIQHISDHLGARADKGFKSTLFETPRILLGMNCLEPGQVQAPHDHGSQDKFYFVHEGEGAFLIGAETILGRAGDILFAPAGVPHGVTNTGPSRLSLLVGITPWK